MKTIQFLGSDGNDYVIPFVNICFLSPDKQNGGTWLELSSGTRLHTKTEIKLLTKMLKGED